jgi:hypothetical protein
MLLAPLAKAAVLRLTTTLSILQTWLSAMLSLAAFPHYTMP